MVQRRVKGEGKHTTLKSNGKGAARADTTAKAASRGRITNCTAARPLRMLWGGPFTRRAQEPAEYALTEGGFSNRIINE